MLERKIATLLLQNASAAAAAMLTAAAQQHQAQALIGEDESYIAGGQRGAERLNLLYSATDAGETVLHIT